MKRIFTVLILLSTGCGSGHDFGDYSESDFISTAVANITIAELRTFYEHGGPTTFTRDYTIVGTVTADDLSGNFYRSFIVEDGTGAVEVKAGTYDLHTLYPAGREVFIHLTGMTYGQQDGMAQLGLKGLASGGFEVDFMNHNAIIEKYVTRGRMGATTPAKVSISEITAQTIGSLVTVEGLTLEGGGHTTWGVPASDSYNGMPQTRDIKAVTASGKVIYIHTSGYADFASAVAPEGEVSVTGIVMRRNNSSYRLKIRDLNDIK